MILRFLSAAWGVAYALGEHQWVPAGVIIAESFLASY